MEVNQQLSPSFQRFSYKWRTPSFGKAVASIFFEPAGSFGQLNYPCKTVIFEGRSIRGF